MTEELNIIGKPFPRVDAPEKVTGEAKYAADFFLPNMLYCKLLRAPFAHAKILHIDTSKAEKKAGVKAVITGKDFRGWKWGWMPETRDEPPLAYDKVRYMYEAVAALAATDEDIAEEALGLINVEYEPLPAVFDPEEAMKEGSPRIHEHANNNVSVEYHWNFGDVDKAFAKSDLVLEDRFTTGRVTHGYVEPPAILAWYDPSGRITIWASKQSPYFIYRHISSCFNIPLSKIRIIQPFIGGGFGGTKNDSLAGDFCSVLLSKITQRPVKWVETMEEELLTSRRRHNMIIYSKMGFTRDGKITGIKHKVIADGGAYTAIGPLTMYLVGFATTIPYHVPNFKYDAYRIFTNNPVGAAMRGHGITHTRFACEIQLDMAAEKLGIDPMEIRLRNAIENPEPGKVYETINKVTLRTCGIKEALKRLKDHPLWRERENMPRQEGSIRYGVGLSASAYLSGARQRGHQSCAAIVRVCEDGTVNLLTGATDAGQGSDTVLCMICAETLGVRMEDIDLKRVDTFYTPCDPGTYGSRVTVLAGQAVQNAALDAKRKLLEAAAKYWAVSLEDVEIKEGVVFVKGDRKKNMSFRQLARIACYSGSGNVIIGEGHSTYGTEPLDLEHGIGDGGTSYSFTAQLAKVAVDVETGKIAVTDFVIAHDAGRPLNPKAVESQNEGGAIQGLGQAIYEEFVMEDGKTLNPTFLDYKMPRSTDVPKIEVIDVITNEPSGPFGAKEASEGSIVSTPPAIVNAIHNALGIWFKDLPVTPERIIKTLKEKQGSNDNR